MTNTRDTMKKIEKQIPKKKNLNIYKSMEKYNKNSVIWSY